MTEFGGRLYIVGHVRNSTTGKRSALIASFKRTTGALNGVNIFGGSGAYAQIIDGAAVDPHHMEARSVTVDSQGRLTMIGVARYWSDVRFAYLGRTFTRRYNASPLLVDGSFTHLVDGGLDTVGRSVALRANEGVVVVGDSTTSLADHRGVVYRTLPSGALDLGFSSNGVTWVDLSPALNMRYDDVIVTPGDTVYAIGEVEIDPTDPP